MPNANWETRFTELFENCVSQYRAGNEDYNSYYSPDDVAFLRSIGYKPREFFDFVEDYCDFGEPSPQAALLIAAVRREFLTQEQGGVLSDHELVEPDLPSREDELEGFRWLPRILTKARAKLKGELHPDIMYSCGGDRKFLKEHDIHAADFLHAVWRAGDDDGKVAAFVRSQAAEA